MKNENGLKILKITGKALIITLQFVLRVFVRILDDSTKAKEHKPTTEELICGERIIGSDKYVIPDQKSHK